MDVEKLKCVVELGNTKIICVVAQMMDDSSIKILSTAKTESKGIHNGVIVNLQEATKAIRSCLSNAETEANVTLKKINISPIVLVENSYKRFSQICEDNEISLVIDKNLPNKELLVSVDTDKIDQVFANLINNAIKWTDKGGEIKFSCTEKETSVDINIIDNGSGISSDDIPHIFERFFKTDSSRSQDGTGLGLSICNHIMELHGGKISVESSEGTGSTFTISLQKFLIN